MRKAGVNVVAICDTNPEVFKEKGPEDKGAWAHSFPPDVGPLPPKVYGNYHKCLEENENLDIVAVATWTKSHAPVCLSAVNNGAKAILCEEPMADSLVAAQQIIDACKKHQVALTVHHTRRWWPAHQEIRNLIKNGVIGDLRSIYISSGGCRVGMLGTHWIDFSRWIVGAGVKSVTGWLGPITENEPRGGQFHDPPAQILIEFKNSVKAFIEQGQKIALPPCYEITGTTGRIINTQSEIPGPKENWQVQTLKDPKASPVSNYMGTMELRELSASQNIDWSIQGAQAIRDLLGGKNICDGEDGYKTLEVLIATYISDKAKNQPITLPLKGAELRLENA